MQRMWCPITAMPLCSSWKQGAQRQALWPHRGPNTHTQAQDEAPHNDHANMHRTCHDGRAHHKREPRKDQGYLQRTAAQGLGMLCAHYATLSSESLVRSLCQYRCVCQASTDRSFTFRPKGLESSEPRAPTMADRYKHDTVSCSSWSSYLHKQPTWAFFSSMKYVCRSINSSL